MANRLAIPALCAMFLLGCALLLLGCARNMEKTAPEDVSAAAAATPAIVAIGAEDGGQPPADAPTAPIPVGKVEYRPAADAQYELLPDKTVSVTGGYVEIIIDGLAFSSAVQTGDGGSARIILSNGASLSGQLTGETMLDISVELDKSSTWSLAGDVRVDALVNGDASFGNVNSNGYTISYNCENAENAYLNRSALTLSGGGRLDPVI